MTVFNRDLVAVVYDQLPRDLRDRVTVRVKSDAHRVVVRALFDHKDGRGWETLLETGDIEGVPVRYIVPGTFIAYLCAAV